MKHVHHASRWVHKKPLLAAQSLDQGMFDQPEKESYIEFFEKKNNHKTKN